jgi:predicted nucleic acid-binding Zn ribbon protein
VRAMTVLSVRTHERHGEATETANRYGGDSGKIQQGVAFTHETKERKQITIARDMNGLPDKKEPNVHNEPHGSPKEVPLRHCKRCGEEIGPRRRFCDGCREVQKLETQKKYKSSNAIRHCRRCGKEIEKNKCYCDECRELKKKESYRRYSEKPEVKEKRKRRYEEQKKMEKRLVRHCKKCGGEVEARRLYCDACKKIQVKNA